MEERQKNKNNEYGMDSSREIKYISFGEIRYYPQEVKVVRNGKVKKLTPIPSLILNYLIKNQNRKISRHDIIAEVWGTTECTEKNFYKQVETLRKQIGDNKQPREYIINPAMNCFALKPTAKIHYVFTRSDLFKVTRNIIAVSILGAAITVAAIMAQLTPFYKSANYESLTNLKGQIRVAATSPDGSVVVFTHKPVGALGWNLVARRIGTEEHQILVNDQDNNIYNTEASFSPSGTQVAWVKTDYLKQCQIFVADFNPSNLSLSNHHSVADCSQQFYGRTPQWRNEDSLLASLPQSGNKPNRIIEINLETGEQFAITFPTGPKLGDYSLYFNKAANKLAYLRKSAKSEAWSELRIFDFSNNSDSLLKLYPHPIHTVAWVNSDTLLAKGIDGFEIVDLDGQTHPVHSDKLEQESYPFSMGDNRIGFVQGHLIDKDISILDLTDQTIDNSLSSVAHDYRAVIAKDTGDIAFLSLRDNKRRLFITKQNIPIELIDFHINARISDMAISPNGKLIAYVQGNRLNILNNRGKTLYRTNTVISGLSFTDNNQNLVYGVHKDGIAKVKQLSMDDFSETFIADGIMPKAAGDGDIYYFNPLRDSSNLILHKISKHGEISKLIDAPLPVINMNSNAFDIIDNKFYYVTTQSKDSNVKILVSKNLDTGKLTNITPISSNYFSINRKITTVVTTKKGKVQNNLASFEIINDS